MSNFIELIKKVISNITKTAVSDILCEQESSQVVRITNWKVDNEFGDIFPEGARAKIAVFSPDNLEHEFLKKSHRYLFKYSKEGLPHHFWSEIISFKIGCAMGIAVPPSFVGIDKEEKCGALIEWFYKKGDLYVSGGDIMRKAVDNYDNEKGLREGYHHNFMSIYELAEKEEDKSKLISHWAQVLLFDSIRGEKDRHHNNWGIVLGSSDFLFSPAFDNGTSLGYEVLENKINQYIGDRLVKYLTNRKYANHHMKWSLSDYTTYSFYEFLEVFIKSFPESKDIMIKSMNFDKEKLYCTIRELTQFNLPKTYLLTEERAEFIIKLIDSRYKMITEVLKI